jgi:hypothetical protein
MDHLSSVKHPHLPIQIPYMPYEDYDNRGFYDFPDRQGWTSEKLEKAHVDESLRQDAVAFLQA